VKEQRVSFPARNVADVELEGVLLDGGGAPCVVSHPHPLAGGDMDHPVIVALWRAAAERGLRALRYNFRGVGGSTGSLTERSPLALGDLGGAVDFLGGSPVLAMGYSYGARATLHAIHAGEAIDRAALVGLPTRLPVNAAAMSNLLLGRRMRAEQWTEPNEIELVADCPRPVLVVAGGADPLVEFARLEEAGVHPAILDGCNHFFSRRLGNQPPDPADMDDLAQIALDFLLRS